MFKQLTLLILITMSSTLYAEDVTTRFKNLQEINDPDKLTIEQLQEDRIDRINRYESIMRKTIDIMGYESNNFDFSLLATDLTIEVAGAKSVVNEEVGYLESDNWICQSSVNIQFSLFLIKNSVTCLPSVFSSERDVKTVYNSAIKFKKLEKARQIKIENMEAAERKRKNDLKKKNYEKLMREAVTFLGYESKGLIFSIKRTEFSMSSRNFLSQIYLDLGYLESSELLCRSDVNLDGDLHKIEGAVSCFYK